MQNYILINRTFEECTPESLENSDFSDSGFIESELKVSFRELVELMKEHIEPSSSPNIGDINTWYGTGFYTSDYRTGTERNENIHYSSLNTSNCIKYWKLAAKFAGHKIK